MKVNLAPKSINMSNCVMCSKNITKERFPGIKCATCEQIYHIKCADVSEQILLGLKNGSTTWLCPKCRTGPNCSIVDCDDEIDMLTCPDNPKLNDVVAILKGIQKQLADLKKSTSYLCDTLDHVQATTAALTLENKCLKKQLHQFEMIQAEQDTKINYMEAEMDRPNQILNKNNIIIGGLPHNRDDIESVVMNISIKIGVHINKDDIISVKQMFQNNSTQSLFKNAFIITLKTLELKMKILNSMRTKKTFYTRELDGDVSADISNCRIFILHHFTKFQSRLYNEAKKIKSEGNFQFLWSKDNNIYLRKTTDSKIYHIFSFNDTNRIRKSISTSTTAQHDIPSDDT